jgi:hypothetical protein
MFLRNLSFSSGSRVLSVALWMGAVMVPATQASTFNIVSGFSGSANPNGVWSYYYNLGSLTAYSATTQSVANFQGSGVAGWDDGSGEPDFTDIGVNNTGSNLTVCGTCSIPSGYIFTDPESLGTEILFTAPSAGSYTISGNFIGADTGQNSHPVEILDDGTVVFSSTISSYGGTESFDFSESLKAGDTIAFDVLTGSAGCSYCNLTTGIQGTITGTPITTATPEPNSLFVCFGAAALSLIFDRKRRSQRTQ